MHNTMPQTAARAKLKLDEALMDLLITKRQIERMSVDRGKVGEVIQEAVVHVEAALDLLS